MPKAFIKSWIIAARLRTLPLAFSSILVGSALAWNQGATDLRVAGLTLLTAILLQVLSNFANDYGDAVSGVDSDLRQGPDRMVQSGAITKEAMRTALIIFSLLTLTSGILLLFLAFPDNWELMLAFFGIGILAIAASIKYTVGKNPYGYAGFGDVFVFVFFGLVAVAGTYFLQTKSFEWSILLPAASLGFFAVGVLNVNNIRDIETDRVSDKFSIPVRIGKEKAGIYHALLISAGLLTSIVFVLLDYGHAFQLAFILLGGLFLKNIRAVKNKAGQELDPHLKQMAIATLLFSVVFSVGQFFG
ncbi:MAG: 1,4-dihydroxy-2-naphthoate polyprenyltransferase [Cyclobacteriaceae bacterium]